MNSKSGELREKAIDMASRKPKVYMIVSGIPLAMFVIQQPLATRLTSDGACCTRTRDYAGYIFFYGAWIRLQYELFPSGLVALHE